MRAQLTIRTAVVSHHVRLGMAQWLALLAAMPPSVMPHLMRDIGQFLPSDRLAELGWRIVGGQASVPGAFLVLTAWTAGGGLAALLAYRRRAIRPAGWTPGVGSRGAPAARRA